MRQASVCPVCLGNRTEAGTDAGGFQGSDRGRVSLYKNEKMTDNLSIFLRLGYVEVQRRSEDGFARVYFEKRLG